jgi:hypothetical protein
VQWTVRTVPDGRGLVFLYNPRVAGCLDTAYAGQAQGTAAVIGPCRITLGQSTTQLWRVGCASSGYCTVTQDLSGRRLDTADGATFRNAQLVIGDASGSTTQAWTVTTS